MRKAWVYVNGEAIPKEDYVPEHGVTIIPDITAFRSPVDGSIVTGRRSLREHNLRNNVVNTAELAGLPPKLSATTPQSNRAAIKQTLINEFNKRGY